MIDKGDRLWCLTIGIDCICSDELATIPFRERRILTDSDLVIYNLTVEFGENGSVAAEIRMPGAEVVAVAVGKVVDNPT